MVNLDGTKAVSKAAKGTHDRLKALEVAIYNLRSSENDKNWQNVEKCLQVRTFSKKLVIFSTDLMDFKKKTISYKSVLCKFVSEISNLHKNYVLQLYIIK